MDSNTIKKFLDYLICNTNSKKLKWKSSIYDSKIIRFDIEIEKINATMLKNYSSNEVSQLSLFLSCNGITTMISEEFYADVVCLYYIIIDKIADKMEQELGELLKKLDII